MVAGNEYSIECVGLGGVPAPALVAIVGAGEEVAEEDFDLAPIEEHSDGMVGGTVSKLFKFEPTKEHRLVESQVGRLESRNAIQEALNT